MITEYVRFDRPAGITWEELVAAMRELAPRWRRAPKLVRKTLTCAPRANPAGASCLRTDRASAAAADDGACRQRIRSTYGAGPRIRDFDTPVVVDGARGGTIG